MNREVVPGPCSWMDCLAAELLSTVVSVDTVTVFPTTVVSVDTVTVFPTTVVSVDTVLVTVFHTTAEILVADYTSYRGYALVCSPPP